MTDRASEYDDAVPGPPDWSRPPGASSNRGAKGANPVEAPCYECGDLRDHLPTCSHAIPNRVQPGTFGPVFDAGVEEGKRQARHATPNRVLELEDDEEQRIVVGALEQYADTKRYTVAASTADRKMLDRQGAIAKSLAQRLT